MTSEESQPIISAGIFIRGMALMIDIVVLSLLGSSVIILLAKESPSPPEFIAAYARPTALVFTLAIFLPEVIWGTSVGKLVFGLRILNRQGQVPPVSARILRYAVKTSASWLRLAAVLSGFYFLAMLGWFAAIVVFVLGAFLLLAEKRTTVHDDIAQTIVARRKRPVVQAGPVDA